MLFYLFRSYRAAPVYARAYRVHCGGQGLLRGGKEQRADNLLAVSDAVPGPVEVFVLGRLPPDGGGQCYLRDESVQFLFYVGRVPNEHKEACNGLS